MVCFKRGGVFPINFGPTMGIEAQKTRPAVVVSNGIDNAHSPILSIYPITSNVARVYSFELGIPASTAGLKICLKIMGSQTPAVDKIRLKEKLGQRTPAINAELNGAL